MPWLFPPSSSFAVASEVLGSFIESTIESLLNSVLTDGLWGALDMNGSSTPNRLHRRGSGTHSSMERTGIPCAAAFLASSTAPAATTELSCNGLLRSNTVTIFLAELLFMPSASGLGLGFEVGRRSPAWELSSTFSVDLTKVEAIRSWNRLRSFSGIFCRARESFFSLVASSL